MEKHLLSGLLFRDGKNIKIIAFQEFLVQIVMPLKNIIVLEVTLIQGMSNAKTNVKIASALMLIVFQRLAVKKMCNVEVLIMVAEKI
jgi:hypothetical protein